MKVNVLTDIDVTFKKYLWWSKWVDIAVYEYNHTAYLIQMSVSRMNKKKFRSVSIANDRLFSTRNVKIAAVGDLTQSKAMEGNLND
ncbi:hypothetical protein VPAG_00055 [Vibrio phage douglas 12A4]|uniref:hypothetical protein n=1 Tax=Vibrio phage douglas 12A4 TaxID=573171 RepID=UPI0002C0AE1E|nr:hypothetical protein VPAG_00055 [Vibrio phage douglas 12A4]AGG58091.1 hypothetical protein VPAG_00055 [Vibrio phage douglas 12A4]